MIKLEDRVTKLEHEMVEVRTDLAENFRAELRAHIKTLEALRENQLELGEEMRREFADVRTEMRTEFADVRREMREGFTKIGLGMAQMTALLNIAIGRDPATD